ncbi:MAG: DUF433 domain-containing protein, partial [Chloroflexota bacterium]
MITSPPLTITVPIRTDEHGSIRVGGTRVLLDVVIACYHQNDTPERIQEGFPTLKLADIYAVITYYLENREWVDHYLQEREQEAETLRRKMETEHPELFTL